VDNKASKRTGSSGDAVVAMLRPDGWDNFFRLRFKYLLPIGNGRDQIIATYKIKLTITT
jgi:hypothetical protein